MKAQLLGGSLSSQVQLLPSSPTTSQSTTNAPKDSVDAELEALKQQLDLL